MMEPINKKAINTVLYTLVIGGSFYLGAVFYSIANNFTFKEIEAVSVREFRPILENYDHNINLWAEDKIIALKNEEVKKWLEPYIRNYTGKEELRFSNVKMEEYLKSLALKLDSEPINARLQFKDNRAQVFVPSISGHKLNISLSASIVQNALLDKKPSVSLPFETTEPEITLDKINDIGIHTLLGFGESDYGKSTTARIHNIRLGMSKFNGIILKPGEEFSFNKFLGEVDGTTGYQAELVIKSGKLVKEFGGGLCQVATTVFRSAILSGLEIKERKPHSFSVQYYNPQGFDATIYPGVVDLRFINDTGAHILIQTRLIGSKLLVEIYGSNNDNRKITMQGPYQYAKQPSGAMKAYFTRKIYQGDQLTKEERFDSVYKAPPPHPLERNALE